MTDRESFLQITTQRQLEAESALIRGDIGPRVRMWSHRDPVSLFGAVGVTKSGWEELSRTFPLVAARLSGGHGVTYELTAFDVGADMAWTAGIFRFMVEMDGAPETPFTLRATLIYRLEDGEWKVVHEHTNFEPAVGEPG